MDAKQPQHPEQDPKGKTPKTKSGKDLGEWTVKRHGENEILLTIPEGMTLEGEDLTIEDVMAAGANYFVVKQGRTLACCSGNVAIA
jgi:hypothetical protein